MVGALATSAGIGAFFQIEPYEDALIVDFRYMSVTMLNIRRDQEKFICAGDEFVIPEVQAHIVQRLLGQVVGFIGFTDVF